MTIGLTDLLRRTAPMLCVALPLAACSHDDGERLAAFVQGNPPPVDTQYAALAMTVADVPSVEPAAVVEQVAVSSEEANAPEEVAEPTWHLVCPDPYLWRGSMVQDPCWREYDNQAGTP